MDHTRSSGTEGCTFKQQKKVMPLVEKVKGLYKLQKGISAAAVGCKFSINGSTATFMKNERETNL